MDPWDTKLYLQELCFNCGHNKREFCQTFSPYEPIVFWECKYCRFAIEATKSDLRNVYKWEIRPIGSIR